MIVRDFKISDIDDVLAIEYESFPDPYPVDILLKLHESGAGFIVAELGNRVVGYVIFWIREGKGHIIAIAINSEYRHMHIGTVLLNKTLNIIFANNIFIVGLEVRKSNVNAINFYLKNGFIKIKEEENYYGDGETAMIMQYIKSEN